MSDDRWQQVEEIFHRAVDLAPQTRPAFLDEACAADQSLRREVESLLAHDSSQTGAPEWADAITLGCTDAAADMTAGTRLGPYRIEGLLGAGGMGRVFSGVDTRLGRRVALKISPEQFSNRFDREAHAISSLNHPHICTLYDVGPNYLVMELCEGETLAARLKQGRLPAKDTLRFGVQIADALAAAHLKGIVHRDLKPTNIMLTKSGAKVLDFGLAKIDHWVFVEDSAQIEESGHRMTQTGAILGTVQYLSPEQAQRKDADARSDIFSFGLVLYEMITGERAYDGPNPASIIAAILKQEPPNLEKIGPPGLLRVLRKCLAKEPANRYRSADEIHRELKALEASLAPSPSVRLSKNAWIALGAAVIVAAVLASWLIRRSSRERWALETATPEIAQLIDAGKDVEAAELARQARMVLPNNPTIEKLWIRSTGEASIASVPPGADVSIRPYRGNPNVWTTLGKTPLSKIRLPRQIYVWRLNKPGFAIESFLADPAVTPLPGFHTNRNWTLKLRSEQTVPSEMVVVAGGGTGLTYPLLQAPEVNVDDFLIDRHEVTNEEYKKFVDAGGYQVRELWKQPFVKDGQPVPWERAMAAFRDRTGHFGPATWEKGDYQKEREKHPVAGISWYEAAAYAEFVGKKLPTAYHWMLASQAARYTPLIAAGSNFRGEGTQAVGSVSSLSGSGTTDMAGNVKEWCQNEARDAKRLIMGGGFGEPEYMFNHTDSQSPWERRTNFGFRCAKFDTRPTRAATARIEVTTRDYSHEKPVSDDVFKAYTTLYAYDKGELNARVEELAPTEGWSRAKVIFDAAYGHEQVIAYLFLPKNASPPFQIVVYHPGAFAFLDDKLDLPAFEETRGFLMKSGRALIFPVYKSTYERREEGYMPSDGPPAIYRDHAIQWSKDLGRSLDYLETRSDIDRTKFAYFGDSAGGPNGVRLVAIEKRIRAAIFSSGGLQLTYPYLPEANPFNFLAHVTIPVLMLNGRYDASFPLDSSQRPLFRFLGTSEKDKKHVIYEGGHGAFPRPDAVRESLDWLDKYLGPVRQ